MKTLLINLTILSVVFSFLACNSVNGSKERTREKISETEKIEVYYFHATRRCATCQAVEKVTKEYVEKNYAGKVNFISINREEEQNSELVQKYEIAGQTLLIVSGKEIVNLTTEAFLNARTNPEKLQELIKSTIDPLLEK